MIDEQVNFSGPDLLDDENFAFVNKNMHREIEIIFKILLIFGSKRNSDKILN